MHNRVSSKRRKGCAGENVRKEGKKREGWLADREHLLTEDEGREEIHENNWDQPEDGWLDEGWEG
jgi:hypothetical protein